MAVRRDIRWRAHATREEAGDAAADRVATLLRAAIERRGDAAMIASGGESPRGLYASLSEAPLDWSRIAVVPSDERCVEASDPASNAGMIQATLLRAAAGAARLLPLYDAGLAPSEAVARAAARLAAVPRPFAVTVLGLGEDGHTASLFPDSPGIEDELTSDARVVAVRVARLPQVRISLTPRALLDTDEICLVFFGKEKRRVYERAREAGPIAAMPVRLFLHQTAVPVTVFWAP